MKLKTRLSAKFIWPTILILAIATSISLYFNVSRGKHKLYQNLVSKGKILGHYSAKTISTDILAYDFVTINEKMHELSQQNNVVYAAVVSQDNKYITSYLDKSNKYILSSNEGIKKLDISKVIRTINRHDSIVSLRFPITFNNRKLGALLIGMSQDNIKSQLKLEVYLLILQGCVLTLVLGLCIYLVFRQNILLPIQQLTSGANRVSKGELDAVVSVSSNDELGHLASAFNNMLDRLRVTLSEKDCVARELKELNQTLEKRVRKGVRNLESAQQQLLQSEKMASVGQLAAGVAHEINNPVGYVNSNMHVLQDHIDSLLKLIATYEKLENTLEPGQAKNELSVIKDDIELDYLRQDIPDLFSESLEGLSRVKLIVRDMKDFSHVDKAERQMFNLHEGLDSTLNIARNELKYKVNVIKQYGDLLDIECIPSQINQVFMNLLVNASQAIEGRGDITISTGTRDKEVWVSISDTGTGIPKEIQKRIFEPFFTTKPVGKGTGLGLSLSYAIIESHGGRVDLESGTGKGSTFTIWLPIKYLEEKNSDIVSAA